MKFCMPHWDALKKAIADRGMEHLIAKSGAEALESTVLQLEGRAAEAIRDPLMEAHNAIVAHVTAVGGLYIYMGDYCPVCEFLKYAPPPPEGCPYTSNESYMIDGPADAVRERFVAAGLL